MMYHSRFLTILFISILAQSKTATVDRILESLHKVLNYSLRNTDSIGLSGIFGVVRARALIADVSAIKNGSTSIFPYMEKNCDEILKLRGKILEPYNEWVRNISDHGFWTSKISYKHLHNECFLLNKNKIRNLVNELSNEAEAACITPEMFEFCLNDSYNVKKRGMDPACHYFLLRNYNGIGYETTHRVLFLQILKRWKSFEKISEKLINFLCEFIYQQAKATQGKYFFFDLFLEQVFLCGVEGYREFLNTRWLKIILENQLGEGCFPTFSRKTKLNSTQVYNEQCSDHATGLASATLALHLHFKYN